MFVLVDWGEREGKKISERDIEERGEGGEKERIGMFVVLRDVVVVVGDNYRDFHHYNRKYERIFFFNSIFIFVFLKLFA